MRTLQALALTALGYTALIAAGAWAQQDEFLEAHNVERESVGVAGLVWDGEVAAYAQSYAEQQRDNDACADLQHSDGSYGENLYWASAVSIAPADAVNSWISEKQFYDYQANSCAAGENMCNHYTQVVWADSIRLGCASVACNNGGGTFVICNYDPPGNVFNERPY
ncbi:hypothetical protein GOP47_0003609 [Adiantum capillus-veneris]|uniref:SCP domain-containing protein n=1 Tax=Adiantum capillus-veneris TaxID=13818 RepID=A0A9D4ZNZ2_ADICA|nr:hypothetical protein GOP47_0003609 [Adiantum capillus-veneris]